jgi:hypothetical protein
MDWNAIAAVSTAVAAIVALVLGVRSEIRASADGRASDRRLQKQLDAQAIDRESEFLVQRVLQLGDAYTTTVAYSGMPQASLAAEQIPLLLLALPANFATLLRFQYNIGLASEHGELWTKYADPGAGLSKPVPTAWVKRELAANMQDAVKMPGRSLPAVPPSQA